MSKMMGPGQKPGGNPDMKRRGSRNPGKTLKRLLGYIWKYYKIEFVIVLIAIVISSLAGVAGNLFIKNLIDDYITPFLTSADPTFAPLLRALLVMAVIYYAGTVATYLYARLMINVTQGTLKQIRDEMFTHMEKLPIKYFDTHAHGDIMSCYTNDTDTLRQMISQSIPQLFSCSITIIGTFISMIVLSPQLTLLIIVMIFVMLKTVRKIGAQSGKYFIEQQKDLGKLNGYIEEMMEGQKVVKVFCHEEESRKNFNVLNDGLFNSAKNANTYANILMPVMANLGNINYVLTLGVGSVLAITGIGGLTLGGLASFLQLTRSFNMPITQVSQQFNSIIMALAGAERVFDLLDEPEEVDNGYVTLVNAVEQPDGTESSARQRTAADSAASEKSTVGYGPAVSRKADSGSEQGMPGKLIGFCRDILKGCGSFIGSAARVLRKLMLWLFHICWDLLRWGVRLCWNVFWFCAAVCLGLGTIAAIFCFGALLILCFQGYPLIGVTLMSLGGLLCGGALTCAAWGLIRRKKTEEKTAVLENEVDTDDEPEEDDFTDEAVEAEEDEHDQIA